MADVTSGAASRTASDARPSAECKAEPGAWAGVGTQSGAYARIASGTGPGGLAAAGAFDRVDSRGGTHADRGERPEAGGHGENTLDPRLPDERIALAAEDPLDGHAAPGRDERTTQLPVPTAATRDRCRPSFVPRHEDLLDRVADWGPADTPAGVFHLVPARLGRDLPLISRWMNDPAAAAFWELSGPQSVTEGHLRAQLAGDGRSVPCVGLLDGAPMSYWEIYRADLDPLARHYPARPHDTGIHVLVGPVADRGRGLGGLLLRTVADLVLAQRPSCARVIAEPDMRNTPSIAAFLTAGFRFSAEVDLPAKRAGLMVRDRSLQHVL
ncbi:GNAT family N-acetyltransferase [Streptomyces sp. NPDC092370]|uniref:GNAT family N-acetyltransferase n=1 Tax=Streptomyces sp. NPDC092370 TaxID=3366016 RepID=UPI0038143FA1